MKKLTQQLNEFCSDICKVALIAVVRLISVSDFIRLEAKESIRDDAPFHRVKMPLKIKGLARKNKGLGNLTKNEPGFKAEGRLRAFWSCNGRKIIYGKDEGKCFLRCE